MTVKGQEFPAYDPRGIQGMGLTYATSNRGACHLRSYTVASEILGIPEKPTRWRRTARPDWSRHSRMPLLRLIPWGCVFLPRLPGLWDNMAPQLDAACEGEWTVDRLVEAV